MTDTIVRLAVPEDRDGITALTELLHEENGLFPLSRKKVSAMLDRYYAKDGAVIGVIGDVGAPVAAVYLGIWQPYYSDVYALDEAFNIIHPEHRRSDYAKRMIGFAKDVSDRLRMPLMMGILTNHRTEAKVRLYERQLEKAGAYFVYNRQLLGPSAWDRDATKPELVAG